MVWRIWACNPGQPFMIRIKYRAGGRMFPGLLQGGLSR
jgi:hypothetical protein